MQQLRGSTSTASVLGILVRNQRGKVGGIWSTRRAFIAVLGWDKRPREG